jgi:hypothetical protein
MARSSTSDEAGLPDWVKYIVALALLAVIAYFSFKACVGETRSQSIELMCSNPDCDYTRETRLQVGETLPLECPKCGKATVVPGFKCPDCGMLNTWNEDRGEAPPTPCTKCGRQVYHE